MKLLVTCGNRLCQVDTDSEKVNTVVELPEHWIAYGITWDDKHIYLATRHPDKDGVDGIQVLDKDFRYQYSIVRGRNLFSDLHQILFYDDRLWVVSSGCNSVYIVGRVWGTDDEVWYPNPKAPYNEERDTKDWNHFNSIWINGDRLYLVAHNFERNSELWKFTYPEREFVTKFPAYTDAHNVFIESRSLIMSSSDNEGGSYGRGLAVSDTHIVMGESGYLDDRRERMERANGYVIVYDREWNEEKRFLVGKGEVYDIRITDTMDYAHNGIILQ